MADTIFSIDKHTDKCREVDVLLIFQNRIEEVIIQKFYYSDDLRAVAGGARSAYFN